MPCNFGGIIGFWRTESGAVSVDWVVLSASIVGMGLATVVAIKTGAADMGAELSGHLASASVVGLGGGGLSGVAGAGASCGVADSGYAPLVATPGELLMLARSLADSNDAGTLMRSHTGYAQQAASLMAGGDFRRAAGFLDSIAAIEQALACIDGSVAEGAPGVRDLRAIYDQGVS